MNRIYLAGPDVFFQDTSAHFDRLEALCQERGLVGIRPADADRQEVQRMSLTEKAQYLFDANLARLRSCQAVLANLQPFRNPVEPDSGTVFEVGFAIALGLPVAGLVPALSPQEHRIVKHFGVATPTASAVDQGQFDATYGMLIEAFDQPLNLMLSRSCTLFETPAAALDFLSNLLRARS